MKTAKFKSYMKYIHKVNKKNLKRKSIGYARNSISEKLFDILTYRQKSHGYKKQNYCDNYYYVTVSGELGCIKSKGHNSGKVLGELLERRKIINKRTHEANKEINGGPETYGIKGVIIKHNRVLDDLKNSFPPNEIDYLSKLFDASETCDMIIDKQFDKAYEPNYHEGAVYAGDLCSSSSCMSRRPDGAKSFYGNIPCCNVVRFEKAGEQVGRCIMYEYNGQRHFIRIYGKPEYLSKMYRLLNAELKTNDLFGRSKCIENLKQETTITDDSTNMYLDGSDYGLVRQEVGTEDEIVGKYTMCTRFNKNDIEGEFSYMKSTSDGPVYKNFRCRKGNGDYVCEHCGADIYEDDDDAVWVDDTVYCSFDCAHEDGWYTCDRCDEWGNENGDGFWIDNNFYCCSECAERAGWRYCEECGEWRDEDTFEYVEDWGESYCGDCIDNLISIGKLRRCDECSELYEPEHLTEYIDKSNGEHVWLCDHCFNSEYYDKIETNEDKDVSEE